MIKKKSCKEGHKVNYKHGTDCYQAWILLYRTTKVVELFTLVAITSAI